MKKHLLIIGMLSFALGCSRQNAPESPVSSEQASGSGTGGVTKDHSEIFGPSSSRNPKSHSALGMMTTAMQPPALVTSPIEIDMAAGGDSAEIFCFFDGTGGDPIISIADGGTATNYVRQGSTTSGTHIPTGGFARYVVQADPLIAKTVYVTVTYNGGTSFTNLYDGPGTGAYLSTIWQTSGTIAGVTCGDAAIF